MPTDTGYVIVRQSRGQAKSRECERERAAADRPTTSAVRATPRHSSRGGSGKPRQPASEPVRPRLAQRAERGACAERSARGRVPRGRGPRRAVAGRPRPHRGNRGQPGRAFDSQCTVRQVIQVPRVQCFVIAWKNEDDVVCQRDEDNETPTQSGTYTGEFAGLLLQGERFSTCLNRRSW